MLNNARDNAPHCHSLDSCLIIKYRTERRHPQLMRTHKGENWTYPSWQTDTSYLTFQTWYPHFSYNLNLIHIQRLSDWLTHIKRNIWGCKTTIRHQKIYWIVCKLAYDNVIHRLLIQFGLVSGINCVQLSLSVGCLLCCQLSLEYCIINGQRESCKLGSRCNHLLSLSL